MKKIKNKTLAKRLFNISKNIKEDKAIELITKELKRRENELNRIWSRDNRSSKIKE